MILPSPELLAVSRRWYQGIFNGNTKILRDYLSTVEELRFIGTGEGEYWRGSAVRDGVGDFFEEIPVFDEVEELEAEAYENGETGWSSFVHRIRFVGVASESVHRTTLIFALDGAAWKIVHRHASVPTPNIDIVGAEQMAIQRLVDAARDEGPELNQTEGLASVLFTDLEGSTTLAATLGDNRWSTLIDQHFQTVEGIVTAHRGQFVKSLGDGTLSSFQSANEALLAAINMQEAVNLTDLEPRLGLRVGIHTDDVVLARGDFFGTVVNKAARIMSSANAGEILVSDETRVMVSGNHEFNFVDAKSVTLKGLPEDHTIYRLEWTR